MIVFQMKNRNKLLSGLNEQQKRAVTYKGGLLLVLAGAGSGKTKVLTHRVAYFIEKGLVKPENCLLLTFTNKAANEMKERMEHLLTKAGLPAKTTPKALWAGTFHSFCAKILRIDGKYIGIPTDFLIYDDEDQKSLIKQILPELNLSEDAYNPAAIAASISGAKNQMLNPNQYAEFIASDFQEAVFKVYVEYEKNLKEIGALDFDDLLLKTVVLFKKVPEVLEKWQKRLTHILVDEWQDTNKVQYILVKYLVGENRNLTVVGDASQSIYSWRGADFRNINYLIRDFPDIKIINLEQNYRSTQNILEAANCVISKNTTHPILKLWTENPKGEKIRIYTATSGLNEADFIIDQINQLANQHISFSDIAVLYRTNAQSRILEESFLHAGIPYVLVGGVRFYDRKEIKDVLSYLRLLVNPRDRNSRKRIGKLGVRRMKKFEELETSIKNVKSKSTLDILDEVLEKTGYLELYEKETEENIARLENIKELRSVATEFPKIGEFLENVALVEAESHFAPGASPDKQNEKNVVTLMTIHAAKGLEFPVVFIVGMEEGLFPHSRSLWEPMELEEERRLAYVGITRAKNLLYLTYASRRLYFGEQVTNPPSRFLNDIPEKLLETIGEIEDINLEPVDEIKGTFDDIIEKYLE
jgi:DNA helicase-2/ATP-dependent DNA helicase PcrA